MMYQTSSFDEDSSLLPYNLRLREAQTQTQSIQAVPRGRQGRPERPQTPPGPRRAPKWLRKFFGSGPLRPVMFFLWSAAVFATGVALGRKLAGLEEAAREIEREIEEESQMTRGRKKGGDGDSDETLKPSDLEPVPPPNQLLRGGPKNAKAVQQTDTGSTGAAVEWKKSAFGIAEKAGAEVSRVGGAMARSGPRTVVDELRDLRNAAALGLSALNTMILA